jgi:hypothetical protein
VGGGARWGDSKNELVRSWENIGFNQHRHLVGRVDLLFFTQLVIHAFMHTFMPVVMCLSDEEIS